MNPKTGERKLGDSIGAFDFCPTPDKSVSVAWAFANQIEQARIFNAHIEASREAVATIAQHIGQARLGKGGEDGFEPGHVAWLEFTHHTARRVMVAIKDGEVAELKRDALGARRSRSAHAFPHSKRRVLRERAGRIPTPRRSPA